MVALASCNELRFSWDLVHAKQSASLLHFPLFLVLPLLLLLVLVGHEPQQLLHLAKPPSTSRDFWSVQIGTNYCVTELARHSRLSFTPLFGRPWLDVLLVLLHVLWPGCSQLQWIDKNIFRYISKHALIHFKGTGSACDLSIATEQTSAVTRCDSAKWLLSQQICKFELLQLPRLTRVAFATKRHATNESNGATLCSARITFTDLVNSTLFTKLKLTQSLQSLSTCSSSMMDLISWSNPHSNLPLDQRWSTAFRPFGPAQNLRCDQPTAGWPRIPNELGKGWDDRHLPTSAAMLRRSTLDFTLLQPETWRTWRNTWDIMVRIGKMWKELKRIEKTWTMWNRFCDSCRKSFELFALPPKLLHLANAHDPFRSFSTFPGVLIVHTWHLPVWHLSISVDPVLHLTAPCCALVYSSGQ